MQREHHRPIAARDHDFGALVREVPLSRPTQGSKRWAHVAPRQAEDDSERLGQQLVDCLADAARHGARCQVLAVKSPHNLDANPLGAIHSVDIRGPFDLGSNSAVPKLVECSEEPPGCGLFIQLRNRDSGQNAHPRSLRPPPTPGQRPSTLG